MIVAFSAMFFVLAMLSISLSAAALCSKRVSHSGVVNVGGERWAFDVALAFSLLLGLLIWASSLVPAGQLRLPLFLVGLASLIANLVAFGGYWRRITLAVMAAGAFAGFVPVALLSWLFYSDSYWLIAGSNHDLMYFFAGSLWADIYPLRPSQEVVESVLGLGRCGGVLIGTGCPVYRDGGYALLSFATAFIQAPTPTDIRSVSAIVSVFALVGLLPLTAIKQRAVVRLADFAWISLASLLAALSTGMLGAYLNENIGTALGAGPLMTIAGLSLCGAGSYLWRRTVAMGALAGVCGLIYGEALIYACVLVAIAVIADAFAGRRPLWVIWGGLISVFTCVFVLGPAVVDIYNSFKAISGLVAQGKAWGGWYFGAAPYYWLAAPFAGLVMQGEPAVRGVGAYVGIVLSVLAFTLCLRRRSWVFAIGLTGLSLLLAYYIEKNNYGYGEHKIIQILGPVWFIALMVGLRDLYSTTRLIGKGVVLLAFGAVFALSFDFIVRGDRIIQKNMVPESIRYGFAEALERVNPGDEVVLDVSSVFNGQRNVRADYATLLLNYSGARVRISKKADGSWVGNTQRPIWGNFKQSDSPDWYLQFQPRKGAGLVIDRSPSVPVAETPEMKLYRLTPASAPLVLAGRGWDACDVSGCSVAHSYSLEIFSPSGCRAPVIRIYQVLNNSGVADLNGLRVTAVGTETPIRSVVGSDSFEMMLPPGYVEVRVQHDSERQGGVRPSIVRVESSCR